MAVQDQIAEWIQPAIAAEGVALVQVRLTEHAGTRTLQVLVEKPDGSSVSIDDCAKLSRGISSILDVEDPLSGAYSLEVSSAGMDRPLVKSEDYERFTGRQIKLETQMPIEGRRRFGGVVKGLDGQDVLLQDGDDEHRIAFSNILQARLVITDEMIRAAQRRQKQERKLASQSE